MRIYYSFVIFHFLGVLPQYNRKLQKGVGTRMHKKISAIEAGGLFRFSYENPSSLVKSFYTGGKRKINCFIFEVVAGTKSNKWVYKRPGSV